MRFNLCILGCHEILFIFLFFIFTFFRSLFADRGSTRNLCFWMRLNFVWFKLWRGIFMSIGNVCKVGSKIRWLFFRYFWLFDSYNRCNNCWLTLLQASIILIQYFLLFFLTSFFSLCEFIFSEFLLPVFWCLIGNLSDFLFRFWLIPLYSASGCSLCFLFWNLLCWCSFWPSFCFYILWFGARLRWKFYGEFVGSTFACIVINHCVWSK